MNPMPSRKKFPQLIVTALLVASRRRCALCYGIDGDTTEKEGQIAHVDRDPSNVAEANAAWLCARHHSRYDARSRQAKGHTPEELAAYRRMLYQHMASPIAWPDVGAAPTRGMGVSIEVFDRRVPVYRSTLEFLREVIKGSKLDLEPILKFARETDEALFLFDDRLADYLRELYRRAVQLHAVYAMSEPPDRRTPELSQAWADAMLWFSEQFEESRRRFAPYLRLSGGLGNQRLQLTAASTVAKTSGRRRG
ncbi:MAG TPA: hypothetical protein VNJ03_05875 [Vicinamibacterales bacterium]|nr:hypothetical protein [Vicinamibacterales bacterium]